MKKILMVVMAMAVMATVGCVRNVRDVSTAMESGEGISVTYAAPFQLCHDLTKQVLKSADERDIVVEDDDDRFLARTRLTLIAVSLKSIDTTHTQITIVTKRTVSNAIPNTLDENGFHAKFAELLGAVQK